MIDPTAYPVSGAIVLGDVEVGRDASLWNGAVARGDTETIAIGDETNIQDLSMIYADSASPDGSGLGSPSGIG